MDSIYSQIIEAKNGTKIPLFSSGKSMESRYNPERDAQNFCNSIENKADIFLVIGIGSAFFLSLLSEKFPESKIIALENSKADIDFLCSLESVKKAKANPNIIFTDIENLSDCLIKNFLPARYSSFKILEQKAWLIENQEQTAYINEIINKALGIISADFSVQSHFGKIWLKNILENAAICDKSKSFFPYPSKDELCKKAFIAAAGPSLEDFLDSNKDSLDDYYFISTDTAYSTLLKYGIIADICLSIDGQNVSYNHFLHKNTISQKEKKSLFCFDLCANSSASKKLIKNNFNIYFFTSGHPLSTAINSFGKSFLPKLFSGSGTVTITALDLALKLGFKNLIVAGADFSYPKGKSYSRGTYLDSLYNKKSDKLNTCEKSFSSLMYRTKLTEVSKDCKTNQILNAYQLSFENYLIQNHVTYTRENNIYKLTLGSLYTSENKSLWKNNYNDFSLKAFLNYFSESKTEDAELLLLPYIAWLRNNKKYKNLKYEELVQLAFNTVVSYNR